MRECWGKISYATLGEAKDAAKALSARPSSRSRHPPRAREYYCDNCQAYHLTSIPAKDWKQRFRSLGRRVKKGS